MTQEKVRTYSESSREKGGEVITQSPIYCGKYNWENFL